MKAAVCYEFGQPLRIEEVELAPPGPGEVAVRLVATAICHSDIHYIQGAWPIALPAIFGHESAGIVERVGAGVTDVHPGEHVVVSLLRSCGRCFYCVQGAPSQCESRFPLDSEHRLSTSGGAPISVGLKVAGFAERAVVDQSQVVRVPDDLPLDRAALLGCGVITGIGAVVNVAHVGPGESVAVIGTGGVGLNAVQGAALAGANPILALDTVDTKLEAARRFGATHTANVARDDMRQVIGGLTGGRGADYVFVTVGSTAAVEQGLKLIRPMGTLVTVGIPPAGAMAPLHVLRFAMAGQRVLGCYMGATRLSLDVPRLVDLYRQGRIKLDELITRRYPLEEINEAMAAVEHGEALRNVIVFA
jgi:Zn-dependent alcohol dehydrogenase